MSNDHTGLITLPILFGIIILSNTLINVILIGIAYGQSAFPQFPMTLSSTNTSATNVPANRSTSFPQSTSSTSVEHGVRITSPNRDQQVPIGILTISGISKDNATSDCHVNVIVNHVKPYQNTSAAGPSGPNDYSNWTFSLTPRYTTIKQGQNEITAKFFCNPHPYIASFYSVNVTGVSLTRGTGQVEQEGKTASTTAITNSRNATAAAPSNQNRSNS